MNAMTMTRHGSATIEFPSDCEVLIRRQFDAPAELLFAVMTKPEHVSVWFTGGGEVLEVCEIDLRVGGEYHYVGVFPDGVKCSFRGTFLEVEAPLRTRETWVFDGKPDADAVETTTLHEEDGVTTLTTVLTFRDQASRDSIFQQDIDGMQSSFDSLEDYLTTLA
jgi:uncharacterized protein YndB with AHSA1/START domain